MPAFLWQIMLHSSVTGTVLYVWARRVRLPSGRAKRHLLGLVLVLPLLTAAVPGRSGPGFRERIAWLDSARLLTIPLPAGIRVYHVVLLVVLMTVVLTVWQELLPALRRSGPDAAAAGPERLQVLARGMPRWARSEVILTPSDTITLATGGWPWRPRVLVSMGALARLTEEELTAALQHENAHWQARRWLRAHALFLVRLVQCHNPVALWAFREYCLEVEIECDAEAVAVQGREPLGGALLKIYESTDRRDVASRGALRKRVDVLLDRPAPDEDAVSGATILAASLVLLLILPWCV